MTPSSFAPQTLSRWERALLALTLIVSLALRLDALNVFLTIDEPTWAGRSLRFAEALASGDLAKTYQSEHPGVLTMWIGAAAARLSDGGEAPMTLRLPTEPEAARAFPALTWWARRGVALATWVGIVALWALLRRLIGPRPALWAATLIALDPFYLAHSRVHHLDAILTTLMALSTASLLVYLQRRSQGGGREGRTDGGWGYLVLSGAMAGLAAANKSPGVFLAAWAALVLAWAAWRGGREGRSRRLRGALGALALWGAAALAALVVAWPALWADPLGTARQVLAGAERQGFNPHELSNYFWLAIRPDPGPAFYPVAWAFRASPWVFVGLIGLVAARRQRPAEGWGWAAALFIVGYALFMTASAKKFDRYLLPVFPWVDALAAAGAAAMLARPLALTPALSQGEREETLTPARAQEERGEALTPALSQGEREETLTPALSQREKGETLTPACAAGERAPKPLSLWERGRGEGEGVGVGAGEGWAALILLVVQLALVLPSRPYYLSYYNPLVGGARAAQQVMLIGWGEGLERAAAYLNAKPSANTLHVAAQNYNEFAPFFVGHATLLGARPRVEPDYFVLYAGQAQRRFAPELTRPLLEQAPEYVVTANGVEYAAIYPNRFYQAETERLLAAIARQGDPARAVVLVDTAMAWMKAYRGPLAVEAAPGPARDDFVLGALQRAAAGRERIWLLRYPDTYPDLEARLAQALDHYATRLEELSEGEVRAVGYALRADAPFTARRPQFEAAYTLGQQARLIGYDLPQTTATPGEPFYVRLYWQASGPSDASYKVFVHLIGPDGQLVAQQDSEPQGGGWPTTRWLPEETLLDDYALAVPADAPPGAYSLAVGMYRLDTMERLPAMDSSGQRQPDDRIILASGIESK